MVWAEWWHPGALTLRFAGLQIKQPSPSELGPTVFIELLISTNTHVVSEYFQT